MAPRARPAKPMPKSARNVRRQIRPQQGGGESGGGSAFIFMLLSVGGDTLNLSNASFCSQRKLNPQNGRPVGGDQALAPPFPFAGGEVEKGRARASRRNHTRTHAFGGATRAQYQPDRRDFADP